jgi:hypothetical protein
MTPRAFGDAAQLVIGQLAPRKIATHAAISFKHGAIRGVTVFARMRDGPGRELVAYLELMRRGAAA